MSSTSSSECMCGECFGPAYGPGLASPGFRPKGPYYQTMGHPLIYYAQVQQTPYAKRRNGESRQGSPNCFVKAFRWYTQERHPAPNPKNRQNHELPNDRTDLNGFAVWLDKKYDEFMLDKRGEQNAFLDQPERSSTLEINKNNNSMVCEMRVKKKFARVRSPWGRRRRNSKEGGDIMEKCNQSFEFILKPKELSRPASECCQQSPRDRSNLSSEIHASKKTITKSRSSDRMDNEKPNTPIEVFNHEGNVPILARSKSEIKTHTAPEPLAKELKDEECQCPEVKTESRNAGVQCKIGDEEEAATEFPSYDDDATTNVTKETKHVVDFSAGPFQIQTFNTDRKSEDQTTSEGPRATHGDQDESEPKKCREMKAFCKIDRFKANRSCPCSEIVVKKDAQCQYLHENQYPRVDAACCCCICDEYISHHRVLCQCVKYPKPLEQQSPTTKDAGTDVVTTASKIVPITFASGTVQTSDHSICLDTNTYPLFMKIVRADKLNEDYIRK